MPFCPFAKNNAVRLERADWWGFLEARFSATLRVKITKSIDFLFSEEIKYKLRWIMLISKLGPEPRGKRIRRPRRWRRGGGGASLSSGALWNAGCQERWEERRGRGEKPGKGPSHFVLLFGNELWLNPGRRQTVYKEPGITLSLFQALQFRNRAPAYYSFLLTEHTL